MNIVGLKKFICPIFFLLILASCNVVAQEKPIPFNQSEELGKVHWYRDYDKAIAVAKEQGKDIVLLFQEVPGCSTCRNYGHNVLSHPLMVEALENAFIPLAIFNNKGGKDAVILKKYKEPSWNNPVVRIIDTTGKNLVKRISNDYSALTLCQRLKEALALKNRRMPEYLNLLEQELAASNNNNTSEAYFKMYCFWTGEKQLGQLDGVLDVEAGFMNHSEVVKVTFDPQELNQSKLDAYAKSHRCEPIQYSQNYSIASNDVHYYLRHSDYKYLPLTALQQTKINSALGNQQSAEVYLSPQQKNWLNSIRDGATKGVVLYTETFETAWAKKINQ